jgi:hypothetical protein
MHLGHLWPLARSSEIVGFGCTRIAAGRQAEIYWDLRRKWPQICRNSPEPAGKTYAHTHLGHPCTTADQRIQLWPPGVAEMFGQGGGGVFAALLVRLQWWWLLLLLLLLRLGLVELLGL